MAADRPTRPEHNLEVRVPGLTSLCITDHSSLVEDTVRLGEKKVSS